MVPLARFLISMASFLQRLNSLVSALIPVHDVIMWSAGFPAQLFLFVNRPAVSFSHAF